MVRWSNSRIVGWLNQDDGAVHVCDGTGDAKGEESVGQFEVVGGKDARYRMIRALDFMECITSFVIPATFIADNTAKSRATRRKT